MCTSGITCVMKLGDVAPVNETYNDMKYRGVKSTPNTAARAAEAAWEAPAICINYGKSKSSGAIDDISSVFDEAVSGVRR